MYRDAYQRGMLTIFFSVGSKPLKIWDTFTKDGYITRFLDQDIKSMVLEIGGTNVSTTYMVCPKGKEVLGISMPFLVMIIKNLKKYFSFEVTILDETGTRRRFRVSNFQSSTQILPLCTVMPIGLSDGWNQIQFNLAEFTRRAYQKQFVEVQKVKINANIRLRRIYFTERLIPEDQLPPEYKLYFPLPSKGAKMRKPIEEEKQQEAIKPSSSQQTVPQPAVDLIKEVSQTSIHSLKKTSSKVSKASKSSQKIVEETDKRASKQESVVNVPDEEKLAETEGEKAIDEQEVVQVGEEETVTADVTETDVEATAPEEDVVPSKAEAEPPEEIQPEETQPEVTE